MSVTKVVPADVPFERHSSVPWVVSNCSKNSVPLTLVRDGTKPPAPTAVPAAGVACRPREAGAVCGIVGIKKQRTVDVDEARSRKRAQARSSARPNVLLHDG